MKNTGIFTAESIGGNGCFQPGKEVSRGEFVTMLVGVLNLELDEEVSATGFSDECAPWLKPYLAAAMRSGLLAGWVEEDAFQADTVITDRNIFSLKPLAKCQFFGIQSDGSISVHLTEETA